MTNHKFQPSRFLTYLKKTFYDRKTQMINTGIIFFLLPLAITLLFPLVNGYYIDSDHFSSIDPMWAKEHKYYLLLWVACGLMCSEFFMPLQKKTARTSMLTCPASSFEKFSALFLIYAVTIPIVMTFGFFFADAVRVWCYRAAYPECGFIHYISPEYLLTFGTSDNFNQAVAELPELRDAIHFRSLFIYSFILLTGLFFQAIFTLGSAVWPKKNLPKTMAFLLGMGFACGILFYYGIKCFHGSQMIMTPRDFGISDMAQLYIIDSLGLLFVIFTWWLSYRRFKEWEVVKRW